ncbi:hypothetical protein ACLB9X_07650 [Streptomyces sp. 5K101]|uniref:hypothetical protein n=1 Tax=Streptomyces sp. 5K101 TaxID=3390037 RepID=UPI003976E75E
MRCAARSATSTTSSVAEQLLLTVSDIERTDQPDGHGKRSAFKNGPIYWSAHSGAHPAVNHCFAAWQRNGWAAGALG